jgi:deoxyhypusine synthase
MPDAFKKVSQKTPEIANERKIFTEEELERAIVRKNRSLKKWGYITKKPPFLLPSRRYLYIEKQEYKTLEGYPEVKGYDFDKEGFDFLEFLESFASVGFQSTELHRSIEVIRKMRDMESAIMLAFTSNMGTCGVRDNITWLLKHNFINSVATTAGAIEEDVAKIYKPFVLGDWRAKGVDLINDHINRTGNIFIPMDRYMELKEFLFPLFKRLGDHQRDHHEIFGVTEFVYEMGRELELKDVPGKEESFVYWAYKNDIPIYCPALLDGAIGDLIYYYIKSDPEFTLDCTDYFIQSTDRFLRLAGEKTAVGAIIIGGSVPKHLFTNAAIPIGGLDYAVYINTGQEMEGSNAGAPVDEAVSWGKIKPRAETVKVDVEASLVFPLIVAGCFKLYTPTVPEKKPDPNAHVDEW